jgi:hypothetical protein
MCNSIDTESITDLERKKIIEKENNTFRTNVLCIRYSVVFGLCPSAGILKKPTTGHNVSKTDSVSVLRCGGWETPLLGPLERANLQAVIEVSAL